MNLTSRDIMKWVSSQSESTKTGSATCHLYDQGSHKPSGTEGQIWTYCVSTVQMFELLNVIYYCLFVIIVRIGSDKYNCFPYADDMTLFCATAPGFQNLIDICAEYVSFWHFNFLVTKSKCMIPGQYSLKINIKL